MSHPEESFTLEQFHALASLIRAFKKCKKRGIGFFVQENELIALADRAELEMQVTNHDYIRENGINIDHADTIVDCGAWD
jgi:hypothetical protein